MPAPVTTHSNQHTPQRVAVVGGGWAGLAAAVRAKLDGHHVTVFEASRNWGGRARTVTITLPADGLGQWKRGDQLELDNGQHILIGAYTETLRLMQLVGVDLDHALLRQPLRLTYPDGSGLTLPDWPAPLDVLAGVLTAKGWHWSDKLALLRTALRWQWAHFTCPANATVDELCARMPQRLRDEFIDPLCISALNTPAHQASGQVFLRVLKDAMFGTPKGSNLLLPRQPLGELWPQAAVRWLQQGERTADLRLGNRVQSLSRTLSGTDLQEAWQVNGDVFDHVVWATSPSKVSSSLIRQAMSTMHINTGPGRTDTELAFEAIATVYAWAPAHTRPTTLPHPMLALRSDNHHPAQFVFDRGQLGGPAGLLAFVVSASDCSAHGLSAAVVRQARTQLGWDIHPIQTIVEKRATFACTPGMYRPPMHMAPGLALAGDHVQGPYPATLEGAMRCGWAAGEVQPAARG